MPLALTSALLGGLQLGFRGVGAVILPEVTPAFKIKLFFCQVQ